MFAQRPYCLLAFVRKLLAVFGVCVILRPCVGYNDSAFRGNMSEVRIKELHNMAKRLNDSVNPDKYACESYYDYVCSRNRPLYSILGHLPHIDQLIELLTELQNDTEQFEAKQKLIDFHISCHQHKPIEDCYRESFEYFKPLFGYIIVKNHIDVDAHEHRTLLDILSRFLEKSGSVENFQRHPIHHKIRRLYETFRRPQVFFHAGNLNRDYEELNIYPESYKHNLRNLEQHRKRNSTFDFGDPRTMLEWSLYLYQSRNKPMSYYLPTFNVHLWMTLYNSTERIHDMKRMNEISECLKLPQFVTALEEARVLAVVYLKSFRHAYEEYAEWARSSEENRLIYEQENQILGNYNLDNKKVFFSLYAQNFCDFGKPLSDNVFYIGLRHNDNFFESYKCSHHIRPNQNCVSYL